MPIPPSHALKLISYNVLAKSFSHHIKHTTIDHATRLALLIAQLQEWDAHIYALQESELGFLSKVASCLPHYNIHFVQRPLGKPDGLAFLIRRDVSFCSVHAFPLLFLDESQSSRCAQHLLISLNNRIISIVHAHLSWDDQPLPHHKGWQQLKHLLRTLPHNTHANRILCGDWNAPRTHFLFQQVQKEGFIDAITDTPTHYGETAGIDHLVHQPGVQSSPLELPTSFLETFSSDHLPVGIYFW